MDPQPHATELQGLDGGTVDVKIRRLAGIVAEALWKLLRRLLSTRCFGQDLKYGPFVQVMGVRRAKANLAAENIKL
jgi:hypothetical protein